MTLTHTRTRTHITQAYKKRTYWLEPVISLFSLYGVPLLAAPAVDFMHFFLCEKDGPGCDFD